VVENGFEARAPDYRGALQVSAWVNKDRNGKKYISVKLADSFRLFKYEPKKESESNEL